MRHPCGPHRGDGVRLYGPRTRRIQLHPAELPVQLGDQSLRGEDPQLIPAQGFPQNRLKPVRARRLKRRRGRFCGNFCPPSREMIFAFYDSRTGRMNALVTSGVFRTPRSPLRQGRGPCTRFGRLRRPRMGVRTVCAATIHASAFSAERDTSSRALFYPMRLRSLDSGRLFSAKIAFRNRPCATPRYGRFCGTFSAAPARLFIAAQVFAPSRPAKGCAPFDPRQGAPCTCPDPPFSADRGLCFSRQAAAENLPLTASEWQSKGVVKAASAVPCPLAAP